MAKKMPRRLVALSSSAIAAIYLTGLVYTRGADAGTAPAASSPPTPGAASQPATTTSSGQPVAVVSASTPSTSTAAATGSYKDGTYTGSGTSRRGGVTVVVTVQGGRITNVTINGV